ncbi:hypothetical protein ACEWY4_017208 [Coilia grayii]|uniref:CARD domain-containing protein n=1 Tax=Coilia grayii TaxID=363190 RepID=A0ABD1JG66_9TELE
MIEAVEKDVKDIKDAKRIKTHRPDMSIWMSTKFGLKASSDDAKISPPEITLKYIRLPDLFRVIIKNVGDCFDLELISEEQSIWKVTLESFEYGENEEVADGHKMPSAASGHSKEVIDEEVPYTSRASRANEEEGKMTSMSSKDELTRVRVAFIDRSNPSVLGDLVLGLKSHDPPVLNNTESNFILQSSNIQRDQATTLIDMVLNKGNKASAVMLSLLKELDIYLYEDLGL